MTRILLRGGYVHTPADPHATALCIEDGTIVWTGDDDASVHFEDNADRVVELDGRLVTPAFVDSHAHLAQTGFAATGVDLTGVPSLAAALEALATHTRLTTSPVILGQGWDETAWPERRAFTRDELDRATDGRPAYVGRVDVHSAVVSSGFLDACPDVVARRGVRRDRVRDPRRAPPGARGAVPAAAAVRAGGRDPARAGGRRAARHRDGPRARRARTSARPRTSRSRPPSRPGHPCPRW